MRSSTLSLGILGSLVLHTSVGAVLWRVKPDWLSSSPKKDVVDLEVREAPPPPAPPPLAEPLPPPPEPPKPPKPRRVVAKAVKPPPEALPPPPPNQEPPPEPPAEPPPPSFGVTLDSVVGGESPVAVPVGNTLMTNERKPPSATPPKPLATPPADGAAGFSPVGDIYIGEFPKLLKEVKADYPDEARRLGIGGQVRLKVGIDSRGDVRMVRPQKRVGSGLDEAAVKALWKFKFSPCRTKAGEAVDCVITYTYTFQTN